VQPAPAISETRTAFGDPTGAAPAGAAGGHEVDLDGLGHRYGATRAVDDVSLSIRAGEIVALLGPSGCGKTTLLRIIAGFVRQSEGRVLIDGRAIDGLPPNMRNIGIVFQNYALFPHMTVAENVAYGLAARGRAKAEIGPVVARMLAAVRLDDLAARLPRQLSGGQQQRVALARALAVGPSILLLDEPFSALDKNLRLDMQIEVKRLQREFGLTAILVTHDQDEAMSVADRIAVMNKGRVDQFDTPIQVYDRPASLFVSGFIGTTNPLAGRLVERPAGVAVVELDAGARIALTGGDDIPLGARVIVTVRPEQLALAGTPATDRFPVRPRLALPIGPNTVWDLEAADGTTLKLAERRAGAPAVLAEQAWCGLRPEARPAIFVHPA
jgi:putative spermidine/putrescine transport system ATP-binding protein